MDFRAFEVWLGKLSQADVKYLEKNKDWKKAHESAQKARALPTGFVEKTMELLEGGSESET
jgi:hypothetical protein